MLMSIVDESYIYFALSNCYLVWIHIYLYLLLVCFPSFGEGGALINLVIWQ